MLCFFQFILISLLTAAGLTCDKNNGMTGCEDCLKNDRIEAAYDPEPYVLNIPDWLPEPILPEDNPLTVKGVALGRQLFYDPILSSDSSMSCASCHQLAKGFTDGEKLSNGVLGQPGTRNTMSLVNLAYNRNGFFWDGRAATLEDQAVIPVEDHLELNESWDKVESKLRKHSRYPQLFREAFGIEVRAEISRELAVKAIAQFERTLISGNSRFDKVVWLNEGWLSDAELRGKQLFFFEETQAVNHPGCTHCHFAPLYTNQQFLNNGLDSVINLEDFIDAGRGKVSGKRYQRGMFKVPTLRNIALTAPYMHDGRFETLEEVLDHYSRGGHGVENESVLIRPFTLTEQDKADLVAFLNTLTDTSFIRSPAFSNPFE